MVATPYHQELLWLEMYGSVAIVEIFKCDLEVFCAGKLASKLPQAPTGLRLRRSQLLRL